MFISDPTSPTPIDIDIVQWQRDIQTFAMTMAQALAAIESELTNHCSQRPIRNFPLAKYESIRPLPATDGAEISKNGCNDRLSKIKNQLAQRMKFGK
jgi:hypothetical protein